MRGQRLKIDKPTLRQYQSDLYDLIRLAFKKNRAVLAEAPTGSGKSVLMSKIVDSFLALNKKWKLDRHLYFIVDELFLLEQFSDHLNKWGISHDIIGDGYREGRSVCVHVCTIQTLAKIPPQRYPALIIIDEAHFSTADRYMDLFDKFPKAKILGLTASPETGSGKGLAADWVEDENGVLANQGNGIFDVMVESPTSMKELTELGYLSKIRYFGIPMKGIENLHMNCGEYKPGEVEKLLQERGTFGDAIKEMQKFPDIENHILFFCKSVKACYDVEIILNAAGYTTDVLEGRLKKSDRKKVMKRFSTGESKILITCKMILKGVDLPYLLMSVDLAPTPSRGTQRQKVGRGTRPAPGKLFFVYLDMVGNHRVFPGSDVYAKINWNFDSKKYNKKPSESGEENTCPLCFAVIPPGETVCPECGAKKKIGHKKEKKEKHLDGDLVELKPVPLSEREGEDLAVVQNGIAAAIRDDNIDELIKIGLTVTTKKKLPFWLYWKLTTKEKVIDIPILYRIQRSLGYSASWVHSAKRYIRIPQ